MGRVLRTPASWARRVSWHRAWRTQGCLLYLVALLHLPSLDLMSSLQYTSMICSRLAPNRTTSLHDFHDSNLNPLFDFHTLPPGCEARWRTRARYPPSKTWPAVVIMPNFFWFISVV